MFISWTLWTKDYPFINHVKILMPRHETKGYPLTFHTVDGLILDTSVSPGLGRRPDIKLGTRLKIILLHSRNILPYRQSGVHPGHWESE